ncbi:MAG: tetratricopeptide repeat protein, partial [Brevinematia bacterium]
VTSVIFGFVPTLFAVSEEAKKHYDAAKTLYVAGDTEGAKKELEKALEIDPNYDAAKKLYEKLGGSTSKSTTQNTTPQVVQSQNVMTLPSAGGMTKDLMKDSILSVLSNSINEARFEIYSIMADIIKESFSDVFRSDYRKEVKSQLKKVVEDVVKNIIEDELSYSVSTVKGEEVKVKLGSISNSNNVINENFTKQETKKEEIKSSEDNKAKAMELYNKAMTLLDDENYSAAKELLIQASQLDPENPKIKDALNRLPK